ncbi:hypothetical protein Dimus_013350, partial [Dionaea muscipula]
STQPVVTSDGMAAHQWIASTRGQRSTARQLGRRAMARNQRAPCVSSGARTACPLRELWRVARSLSSRGAGTGSWRVVGIGEQWSSVAARRAIEAESSGSLAGNGSILRAMEAGVQVGHAADDPRRAAGAQPASSRSSSASDEQEALDERRPSSSRGRWPMRVAVQHLVAPLLVGTIVACG